MVIAFCFLEGNTCFFLSFGSFVPIASSSHAFGYALRTVSHKVNHVTWLESPVFLGQPSSERSIVLNRLLPGPAEMLIDFSLWCWMESFFHSSFNRFVLIDREYWYKEYFLYKYCSINHCWHWWCVLTSLTFLQVMFITTARAFTSQTKPEGLASLLPNRKRDRRLGELSSLAWNCTNDLRNFWRITWQIFLR